MDVMDFKSSQVSLTSLAQRAVLYCHEELTDSPTINAIVSRIAAIALSPAAALDLAFHLIVTPISVLYAIGKSVVIREADFSLPWQHIQRIREAVFPLLFGTAAGIVHPYAGIYFTKPADKHIAGGILLSNTTKQNDIVVSPTSAFDEVHDIMHSSSTGMKFPIEYAHHVKTLATWERPLEMVQSTEVFDLKLRYRGMKAIDKTIDTSDLSTPLRDISKKVALVAYLALAALDIAWTVASAAVMLGIGVVQLFGAKAPAYLETTSSPVFHVYSIARIVMTVVSSIVGLGVSILDPEKGLEYSYSSSSKFKLVETLLFPILKRANREIKALGEGERLMLPIVLQNDSESYENDILPSRNSHMTYLLIEKNGESYSLELIERGNHHGITSGITYKEASKIARDCLRLRYFSTKSDRYELLPSIFKKSDELINLGTQGSFNNCVITNLFAAFDVLNDRDGGDMDLLHEKTKHFRQRAMDRYDYFQYDFFPFAPMDAVIEEILELKSKKI